MFADVLLKFRHARHDAPESRAGFVPGKLATFAAERAARGGVHLKADHVSARRIAGAAVALRAVRARNVEKLAVRRRAFRVKLALGLRDPDIAVSRLDDAISNREEARAFSFIEHGEADQSCGRLRRACDAAEGLAMLSRLLGEAEGLLGLPYAAWA